MISNAINSLNSNIFNTSITRATKSNLPAVSSSPAPTTPSSTVSISQQSKIANISSQYDVTHLSSKEMKGLANDLKENGLIDDAQFIDLTFVFVPPGGTHDENAPINYLSQYQNQTALSKIHSTPEHTKFLEKLTSLLETLHKP